MNLNLCKGCLEKQRKIDRLEEENQRLRQQLRRPQRQAWEGPFRPSTPAAKIPLGRICEQTGVGLGTVIAILHRMAALFGGLRKKLIAAYNRAPCALQYCYAHLLRAVEVSGQRVSR